MNRLQGRVILHHTADALDTTAVRRLPCRKASAGDFLAAMWQ
jgi:hypothetical protein